MSIYLYSLFSLLFVSVVVTQGAVVCVIVVDYRL